jgi:hypothetical protein
MTISTVQSLRIRSDISLILSIVDDMLGYLGLGFYKSFVGAQFSDGFGDVVDDFDKLGRFRRRHPGKLQASGGDSHVFHQILEQRKLASGVVITFQVMAFTRMSPGHPHAVSPFSQSGQKKLRAHATGAGNPYDTDIGRVFHPAYTGEVGCPVAAPVAQKGNNFRIPFGHQFISFSFDPHCRRRVPGSRLRRLIGSDAGRIHWADR